MKYLPLFFCIAFYACDVGTNSKLDDLSSGSAITLNSSSSVTSSSSIEISSSSEQPIRCRTFSFDDELHFYFNKQGGNDSVSVDNVVLLRELDMEECEYIRADHFLRDPYDENAIPIKIESDYCKNNYCPEASHLSNSSNARIMKKECSWYSVMLISKNSLLISVNKNETGKERSEYVSFIGGGGCDLSDMGFTIFQSAE
ncbi:MAG: hypothetical protein LBQ76_04275 [Candidatus Fibromonas sp.]|jgi:hypothetical protein|nr:hypothetical protein [Candidatus Fibromonas sp.]